MLLLTQAFAGGYDAGAGRGESSFARIAFSSRMRGDSGKRSRSIASRSSPAMIALSSSEVWLHRSCTYRALTSDTSDSIAARKRWKRLVGPAGLEPATAPL